MRYADSLKRFQHKNLSAYIKLLEAPFSPVGGYAVQRITKGSPPANTNHQRSTQWDSMHAVVPHSASQLKPQAAKLTL